MSFANYLEALCLGLICNDIPFTVPAMYIGLWLSNPGEDGVSGTEVSGGGYARVSAYGKWTIPLGDPLACTNDTAIIFPEATADWGTVTHFAITTAISGGFVYAYGTLFSAREIIKGSIPRFDIETLAIALD